MLTSYENKIKELFSISSNSRFNSHKNNYLSHDYSIDAVLTPIELALEPKNTLVFLPSLLYILLGGKI